MPRRCVIGAAALRRIATKSSLSGKPYEIRLRDGSLVFSGEYLGEHLDRIERGH